MSRWCSLMSVLASLLVHLVGLVLMLWLVPHDTVPSAIVLDLSEVVVSNSPLTSAPAPQLSARAGRGEYPRAEVAAPLRAAGLAPPPTPPQKPQPESGSPAKTQVAALADMDDPPPERSSLKGKLDRSDSQPMATVAEDTGSGTGIKSPKQTFTVEGRSDHPSGIGTRGDWGGDGEGPHAMLVQSGKGQNQGLALAVPGAGQEGLGAEYGSYLAGIRQRIQEALEYPPAARRRGLTGTVHVEIVIRPDGAVGQVSVLHSSSHRILDEAALDAVRRLPPLPFPAGLPPRALSVRLPVVFELW